MAKTLEEFLTERRIYQKEVSRKSYYRRKELKKERVLTELEWFAGLKHAVERVREIAPC